MYSDTVSDETKQAISRMEISPKVKIGGALETQIGQEARQEMLDKDLLGRVSHPDPPSLTKDTNPYRSTAIHSPW